MPSAVEIQGSGYDLNSGAMNGIVESPRAACLRNRTVRMRCAGAIAGVDS